MDTTSNFVRGVSLSEQSGRGFHFLGGHFWKSIIYLISPNVSYRIFSPWSSDLCRQRRVARKSRYALEVLMFSKQICKVRYWCLFVDLHMDQSEHGVIEAMGSAALGLWTEAQHGVYAIVLADRRRKSGNDDLGQSLGAN